MRIVVAIVLISLFACTKREHDKITVPKLHAGFYNNALEQINDKLESDPGNELLVEQKLFYCEQLDWPTTCISALDTYKDQYGMTNQLVEQYIAYYLRHERYQRLLEVLDQWDAEYDLKKNQPYLYLNALARSGKRARTTAELRNFLREHQSLEDLVFASRQYLLIKDTLQATYNLSKVRKLEPEQELMWEYGNMLYKLNYPDRALMVMDEYIGREEANMEQKLIYARLLDRVNRRDQARAVIKSIAPKTDTLDYLLAEWYKKDLMWDSAGMVLNQIITEDSSNYKAFWKAGRLYEDRGWFTTALPYFNYLKENRPADTLAHQRIVLIQRKIAYLQRLKFEESKIPTIDLEPKKIEN